MAATEIDTQEATVLIVDDEPDMVELYAHHLETEFEVRTAVGGEAARERLAALVDETDHEPIRERAYGALSKLGGAG